MTGFLLCVCLVVCLGFDSIARAVHQRSSPKNQPSACDAGFGFTGQCLGLLGFRLSVSLLLYSLSQCDEDQGEKDQPTVHIAAFWG